MSPNRHSISADSTAPKLKTPLKASVVILTSVILAACGSSGSDSYTMSDIFDGSSPTIPAPEPTPEPTPEPGEPGEPGEPNEPEVDQSGVQSLNIVAGPLGVFNTTTRDFAVTDDSVEARADTASDEVLPAVTVTTSSDDDTDLDNDFKSYTGSAEIPTALGNLPLNYTSVYKDFGDNMRIGHINGGATLGESQLPVDGVTVTGNATKAENVPTDGTAEYTGDATYRELGLDNDIEYGSSAFTADFVAKKVAGELNFANAGDINLTADIDGNKFSGAAADNDGYNTEGGFYGGDAEYIGGIYEGNGAQGTYGAEKNQAPEPEPEPEPEYTSGSATTESGAQSLNIVAGPLGVFNTTTRDFAVTDDSVEARADTASDEVLPAVTVTTSSDNDTDLDNDFKSYTGSAEIPTALGNLPLNYTSVYKDFGDNMRIGHINGDATLGESQLPVDGVIITGNQTNTLPTDGSVAYAGDATYRELGLDKSIEYGSSTFTADFAAKTVDGTLSFNNAGDIAIAGDIDGSQFAGTSGAYTTEGGFYGDDAKYLGGIYSSETAQGTFGAEKQ